MTRNESQADGDSIEAEIIELMTGERKEKIRDKVIRDVIREIVWRNNSDVNLGYTEVFDVKMGSGSINGSSPRIRVYQTEDPSLRSIFCYDDPDGTWYHAIPDEDVENEIKLTIGEVRDALRETQFEIKKKVKWNRLGYDFED